MRNYTLILTLFISFVTFGQMGVNTETPNGKTLLHISEQNKTTDPIESRGIIIPRLTEVQRDAINPGVTENSLLVYNTVEDCYNYWNNAEQEWKSLCGKLGKSQFTFDCAAAEIKGTYVEGRELSGSNYLSIPVTVTKPGEYTITATTSNGYSFFGTGSFLNTGNYTIQVAGQGTPVAVQADDLTINVNGVEITCTPAVQVTVMSASGTYTMSCGSATVNGVYKVGTALTASNTITLPIVVTDTGSYTITTNTVNGISFSGSGTFAGTGNQNVTLYGTGKPSSTTPTVLTITSDSQGGASTTCSVTVIVVIPVKTVLHIGYETAYGYSAFTGPSRKLMDSPTNFGTAVSSRVKAEGYTHTSLGNAPSDAALLIALNNKPDIVIIGFAYTPNATAARHIADYLNKKGVVINFNDNAAASQRVLSTVFSDPSISAADGAPAGSVYTLANSNDAVLNGPFGDIRGKYWGEDASPTVVISGLTSGFIPYSYAQPINSTTSRTGITGLRHSSLNFVWFGDGGFLSNERIDGTPYPSNTIEPFVAPSSGGYFPVETAYGYAGNGNAAGGMQVQNSIVFANILAWAIEQAEHNGINSK